MVLIRSPKAALFRRGSSILTEARARAATCRPRPGTTFEEQDVYFRASALLEGGQNNLLLGGSEQAVARPTLNPARLPANPHGMPIWGCLVHLQKKQMKEGERERWPTAHTPRGDSDVPEDPRGLERAFASTAVDSEAAGPRTVETRGRANWPAQGNATEPRPPSQKPTRTRDVEGEPPWEGINEQRRGTEARQADSVRNAAAHRKTHLPRPKDFSQRGGVDHDVRSSEL
jgi:hypothetical protein